jgi:hypothetical protein
MRRVAAKTASALRPALIPFLLVGLLACRRLGGSWSRLWPAPAIAAATWVPPLALHVLTRGAYPFSHRYALPAAVFLLPWCAAGLLQVADWISVRRPRLRLGPIGVPTGRAVQALVLALLAVASVGPRRGAESAFLDAGAWVRARQAGESARTMATREKLSYYAGGEHVSWPAPTAAPADDAAAAYARRLREACRARGVAWLLLDAHSLRKFPPALREAMAADGFREAARFAVRGATRRQPNTVWVYTSP